MVGYLVASMSRWLEILLRDVDGLPVRLLEGLRAIRALDEESRRLAQELARDEAALLEDLKRALRTKEQVRAEKKSKKSKESEEGGLNAEGTPAGEPTEFVFEESVYQARREDLARRRSELNALVERQLGLSSELYLHLDDKVNHVASALKAIDNSFSEASSEGPRRKKRTGLSEAEVFEAGIEAAMRERTDPNEPLYCTCKRLSFGDMIACDNEDCPIEWFHYPCVGVSTPPASWLCPLCSAAQTAN